MLIGGESSEPANPHALKIKSLCETLRAEHEHASARASESALAAGRGPGKRNRVWGAALAPRH